MTKIFIQPIIRRINGYLERNAILSANPNGVRFDELVRICDYFFGDARQKATSHWIYKMPWPGDPRVNIQENRRDKGMAKRYQVGQVIAALRKLRDGY